MKTASDTLASTMCKPPGTMKPFAAYFIFILVASMSRLYSMPVFDKTDINGQKTQALQEKLSGQNKATLSSHNKKTQSLPDGLEIFMDAYPDISFTAEYDDDLSDWKITLKIPENQTMSTAEFYWADGSFLPREHLGDKQKHWTLLYNYAKELKDPSTYTQEEIERIRLFSSADNRQNGSGTPQYFFDAVYDCKTRGAVERHIKKTSFLGKILNVHEKIIPVLKKIESEINEASQTDNAVQAFIDDLYQADGYLWRNIRDSNRKSFHAMGLAVDVLPKRWGHKIIYWNWQAQHDPQNWMLTPLSERWMPPDGVIKIFEDNGFIWGGKWPIWDNMHFEYRPELILYQRSKK
ncbi:M15 family metallopeptidase [Treponema parvum]|uniref:M15 family metallopeptidase n=1 Tax=Treponema parvum TaxID=138851 RepID=A0A975F4K6_9SPIR|nr:M15 family metallopeptidase [Treponema parvum]QTQ14347.1 M15 family metallopeptidase [Treponema parvum]